MSGDDDQGSGAAADAASPTAQLIEMFADPRQKGRPVFRKLHGVAHGRLKMDPNRPTDLRVGVFAHDALPIWVRFSSDAGLSDPHLRSTLGLGLPGENRLGEPGGVADFMFQNRMSFSGRRPEDLP